MPAAGGQSLQPLPDRFKDAATLFLARLQHLLWSCTRLSLGLPKVVDMTPRLIKKHCELDTEGAAFLEHQMGELNFSARTLADLKGLERIDADSVLEAVNYRTLDWNLWS